MKLNQLLLLPLLLCATVLANAKFYAEAGVGYATVRGGHFQSAALLGNPVIQVIPGPIPPTSTITAINQDSSTAVPFLAVGYSVSERLGLRLSYQYLGDLSARVDYRVVIGGDALLGTYTTKFNDDVHIVSLAPEFTWPLAANFSLTLAPQLNWVSSDSELLSSTQSTQLSVIPRLTRQESEFTFGASAACVWHWTETSSVVLRYQYADLKPSWQREAHLVTGAVRWRF